jgi:hypothetical protein
MVPVATIHVPETIVHAGEAGVESAAVESAKSPGMETAAVKPAKSAAMEPAAMEPAKAATMETPASTMETPASTMTSVGDLGLGDCGAEQQCNCDTCQSPADPGPDSILG